MKWIKVSVTLGALLLLVLHNSSTWTVDAITLALFVIAFVFWLPFLESLEFGGLKIGFQKLQKAAEGQVSTTRHQTIATIISWAQADTVLESRKLLFELEDEKKISRLPIDQWEKKWKEVADHVSQAFNSAGLLVKADQELEKLWVKPTRRAIMKSWWIARPRIQERRREQQDDLWQDFDLLAEKTREYCKSSELEEWGVGDPTEN